jgi:hypothetical protein
MKNFLKYFNLSKFYSLNIFLWLSLSLTILNYSQFYIMLFFRKPLGIDTISNLLVLEGQIFVVIVLILLFFFLFLIELILRKKSIIKTYNTLVLNKYPRIILSITAFIFFCLNFVLINLTHHLVDYLYYDN